MSQQKTIKVGDLGQPLQLQLTRGGVAVDLTNAVGVTLKAYDSSGNVAVDYAAAFGTRVDGEVDYAWQTNDTVRRSRFAAVVKVDWGAFVETFPNAGHFVIEVQEDFD